ncbi:uncharacterized protein LOC135491960 isoform X2 [Lineus longissimus]|uniref:uncharacterized protein LOC135491960 isoform X2 n=1 Tax=Lineus longissimus TaxID=88925 RepID=UPI002B4E9DF6
MMAPTDEEEEDVLFDHRAYRRSNKTDNVPTDPVMTIEDEEDDVIFDQAHLLPNHVHKGGEFGSSKCYRIWTTMLLFLAFCGLGLCMALPGPTLLDLQERTNTDTEDISRIFIGRSTGYLIGSVIGGLLIDMMNKSFLMSMFLLLMAIGTAILPWCTRLYLLIITIAFQGVSMGLVDTAGNLMCVQTWGRKSPPYMQALHFFFGLGAFVAPLIAEPFLSQRNATVVLSLNATFTDIPETVFLSTTPKGPVMGNVLPLSGRDIGHLGLKHVHRRDISEKNLRDTKHASSLLETNSNRTTEKIKKPTFANGKFLTSDPKVADGKNLKVLHDVGKPQGAPSGGSEITENLEPHSVGAVAPGQNSGENVDTEPPGGLPGNPVVQKRIEKPGDKELGDKLETTTPHLRSNATLPPLPTTTTLIPRPKKPLTNGRILSKNKDVAAGKNVPRKLVDNVQKGLKKPVTQPPVIANTTVQSNITGINVTVSPFNSTTQGVPKTDVPTTPLMTTQTTTVTTTTVSTTTTTTPVMTSLAPSLSSEAPNVVGVDENVKLNSDWMPLKPTATVINSTVEDSFLTRIKTGVKKTWHTFTAEITKVQFVYLIVSIFLVVVAMMFCSVCCCLDRRNNGPIAQSYNLHHLQQRDSIGFKVQIILLLFLFNFIYVGMEVTYGGFVMSFAVDYLKWDKSDGSFVTALFWGSFALTRLLSIVAAKCLRPTVMLIVDLLITSVSLLALLLTVNTNDLSMWICTALLGIGMASFFPTMLSWAERYINMTGKITATLIIGAALAQRHTPPDAGKLPTAQVHPRLHFTSPHHALHHDVMSISLSS